MGKAARIGALLKKGGFTFRFRTVTGGRLKIAWFARAGAPGGKPVLVATGKARIPNARRVKFTIRLTRTGRRMLKAASSVRIIAHGTYRPTGKPAVRATRKFTLRR
jgi:hypothetical protein